MSIQPALTVEEKKQLLHYARRAIQYAIQGQPSPELNMKFLPPIFQEAGASFVTLTINGDLRGCVGALEAHQSLVEDVCEHAVLAAQYDTRFAPVNQAEVDQLSIEISRLTALQPVHYDSPEELLLKITPGIDGVVIRDGQRRATYLPQVWQKLPTPPDFLSSLCQKMGAAPDLWRQKKVQIFVYQIESFHE